MTDQQNLPTASDGYYVITSIGNTPYTVAGGSGSGSGGGGCSGGNSGGSITITGAGGSGGSTTTGNFYYPINVGNSGITGTNGNYNYYQTGGWVPIVHPLISTPPAEEPKEKVIGCKCKRCDNYNEYAESNQTDGSFICYGCRKW